MQAVAQHSSPPSEGKSQNNDHSQSTSLRSAYKVSRSISTLKIIAAFPCRAKQPWEHCTVLSVFPLGLAKHSSLENIVIDYFLDPAGIIMAQTNAAAGNAREIERVSSAKWNDRCGGLKISGCLLAHSYSAWSQIQTPYLPSHSFHTSLSAASIQCPLIPADKKTEIILCTRNIFSFRLYVCEKSHSISKFEFSQTSKFQTPSILWSTTAVYIQKRFL